jgi:hypothetical protein
MHPASIYVTGTRRSQLVEPAMFVVFKLAPGTVGIIATAYDRKSPDVGFPKSGRLLVAGAAAAKFMDGSSIPGT